MLQVRADLVETAQKTLEGEGEKDIQEANVRQIVERKTSDLQVLLDTTQTLGREGGREGGGEVGRVLGVWVSELVVRHMFSALILTVF